MAGFDQPIWKAATTWDGEMLSNAALWQDLTDENLPETFRERVITCSQSSGFLRKARLAYEGAEPVATERALWKVAFANLVSGRFTELVFDRAYRTAIEARGLLLTEETTLRNFLDYRIHRDDEPFALAINVKNAGVQFRDASKWVGLEPADTLPIATYKIFGSATAPIPPLVYVYLVDWGLLARLREAYWNSALNDQGRKVFRLLTCTKKIQRIVEDEFIESTVADSLDALVQEVGYGAAGHAPPFRAISGARCRRIFFENESRSPYVFRQRMNTDPNTHISVSQETVSFPDFIDEHLATPRARAALLADLAATTSMTVPNSTV